MKMLKPTMPIYTTIFPQDFWEHNFQQGGPWPSQAPLRIAYVSKKFICEIASDY